MTALMRVRRVLQELGLGDAGPLKRAPSVANEVWYVGATHVLRMSSSRGTRRLEYEVQVAETLPPEVHYPTVVGYGRVDFAEWLLLRRVRGEPLSRAWPALGEAEQRSSVAQLAALMRCIHSLPPPVDDDGAPVVPPFLDGDTLECPHPLPAARLLLLLDRVRSLPHVEARLVDDAVAMVDAAAGSLDTDPPTTLVHGDLHLENVLWDRGKITAVLDFEYARTGPPDLDLEVLLRFCADPELHVAAEYEHLASRDQYRKLPHWLRESYPELFAHPDLGARLAIYALAYDVRDLLLNPPNGPVAQLPVHHPYNRVERIVANRTHLQWMDL